MKMDQQPGNIVTQFFAWLAAVAAWLGIATNDLVYMIFGLIGVVISVASYVNGRLDARKARRQDEERTRLLAEYLAESQSRGDKSAAAQVLQDTLKRVDI